FFSYNAHINSRQIDLCKNLAGPYIVISTGLSFDVNYFKNADSIISTECFKPPSLKALSTLVQI
ncbi:MAG: hypothetical protein WC197_04745, partial [Candidatus Gastranaerophilaceae bacterium]